MYGNGLGMEQVWDKNGLGMGQVWDDIGGFPADSCAISPSAFLFVFKWVTTISRSSMKIKVIGSNSRSHTHQITLNHLNW